MFTRPVLGLIAGLLSGLVPAHAVPVAEWVGTFVWRDDGPDFGGLSSLELSSDGSRFLTLSDRSEAFEGTFTRDGEGAVNGADITFTTPLNDAGGIPLSEKTVDSEGLATLPDGTVSISFEGAHRLTFRSAPDGPEQAAPLPPGSDDWEGNLGLEALAAAPDGTLWALTEGTIDGNHAVLRYRGGAWLAPLGLHREGTWRPVGADFGPDGRLYLLERDFWPLVGFMSRVLRFDAGEDGLSNPQILFQSRAGMFDNLEGIAVWQDRDGAIRLTLISDDNFLPVQKTEIVDLRVTE